MKTLLSVRLFGDDVAAGVADRDVEIEIAALSIDSVAVVVGGVLSLVAERYHVDVEAVVELVADVLRNGRVGDVPEH